MPKAKETASRKRKTAKPPAVGREAQDETHVPREAENFEHTLRRLTVEKQKARAANFGLYR